MSFTKVDERFLRRALNLARMGIQTVSPNPAVGAVIVQDDEIISEGWHKKKGSPHAEALAIKQLDGKAEGATIYVNLEPCSHWGQTPPCCDAIIKAGIKRVVCCGVDPNPKVQGRGFSILKDAGIEVSCGHLEKEARKLNEAFYHYHETKRPFIHVKAGMSMDGRIATSTYKSQWITSEDARHYAHKLRQRYDAILVGINTVIQDDPSLDVRLPEGGYNQRLIMDSKLRLPLDARVLTGSANAGLSIITTNRDCNAIALIQELGAEVIVCDEKDGHIDINDMLKTLGKKGINSILVEGGGEIISAFFRNNLVNKLTFVYAPLIIGGKNAIPAVGGSDIDSLTQGIKLKDVRSFHLGRDIAIEAYPVKVEQQ